MSTMLSDQPKRRARKPHRCFYCGQRIEVGEVHGYCTGVDGGDFWAMRYHPECEAVSVAERWDEDDYMYHEPGEFKRPTKTATVVGHADHHSLQLFSLTVNVD